MVFKRKRYRREPVTPLTGMQGRLFSMGPTDAPEQPKEEAGKEPDRMAWFRRTFTRCQNCGAPGGEVHHHCKAGHGIMGRTAPDKRGVWLCSGCHRHWHDHKKLKGLKTTHQAHARFERIIRMNQVDYAAACDSGGTEPRTVEGD